jgi:Domain of unknown function (DUF4956)
MKGSPTPRRFTARRRLMIAALVMLVAAVAVAGSWWSPALYAAQTAKDAVGSQVHAWSGSHALLEGLKLAAAALIGLLVTFVQRYTRDDQPPTRSMEQAHVLLCVAGALTMLIVGDSLARAFGIAGAASLIKFRTPVEDPRDITVLFLLMALGMAAGLGLMTIAGVGALFVCTCLLTLGHTSGEAPRAMKVALVADGQQFPAAHVSKVFADHHVAVAPLEIFHGDQTTIRYRAVLDPDASLEEVSARLLNGGTMGLKSVSWETPKKNRG